jgi:hypothetical protein
VPNCPKNNQHPRQLAVVPGGRHPSHRRRGGNINPTQEGRQEEEGDMDGRDEAAACLPVTVMGGKDAA